MLVYSDKSLSVYCIFSHIIFHYIIAIHIGMDIIFHHNTISLSMFWGKTIYFLINSAI